MKKIALLSDTHGYLMPKIETLVGGCDEIWHAGDVGHADVIAQLASLCPVKAVYGNIDGQEIRMSWPEVQSFTCEELKVLIIHIGGYPGKYQKKALDLITREKPGLFVSGHSHILKVMYDHQHQLLHINPGAAGMYGLHKVPTFVRFNIDKSEIKDLEIIELERNNK